MPLTITKAKDVAPREVPLALDAGAARKRITVLGATGSVGQNTLDVIGRNPRLFEVVALTANRNAEALAQLALLHQAKLAVLADESRYGELKERLAGTGIEVAAGSAALIDAASRPADCVMAGIIGAAGLRPDARGRSAGPQGRAGEQGMPRVRRADFHGGGAQRGNRSGAGRTGAFGGVSGDRGFGPGCHRAHRAHRVGWTVSHLEPGAARAGDAPAGADAPQLVDGPQDHDRLRPP